MLTKKESPPWDWRLKRTVIMKYLLPRLVIQIFFERLSLYWQVESRTWSVIHVLRLPALGWLGSGISVLLFLWAAEAQLQPFVQWWGFLEGSLVCLLDASLQCHYKVLTSCSTPSVVSSPSLRWAGRQLALQAIVGAQIFIQAKLWSYLYRSTRVQPGAVCQEHVSSRKGSSSHLKCYPGVAYVK